MLLGLSLLVRHQLAPLLPGVIFRGDSQRRELALTIDNGPSHRQAFDQAAAQLQSAAAPCPLPLRWFPPGGGLIRPSMLRSDGTSSHLAHHLR